MNSQEIIEGNKLIAEFMGGSYKNETFYFSKHPAQYLSKGEGGVCHEDDLFYNTRWDWLMPVMECAIIKLDSKIASMLNKNPVDYETRDYLCLLKEKISWTVVHFSIKSIYRTCIEFIKWHNQQSA
jgi:hypothetical protein